MSSAGIAIVIPIREEAMLFTPVHSPDSSESIVLYVAVPGSMVPMRVLGSDSIESVKLQIQYNQGFDKKAQKLVCQGRELARSNSLVREYGVASGNVIHLVLRLSDFQLINVKTACGKEFTFRVNRSRNVKFVKHQLAKKGEIFGDIEEQEVLYGGEQLEDQRLIDDLCTTKNDAVIHLFVRKSAKIIAENYEISIVALQSNDTKDYDTVGESGEEETNTWADLFIPREIKEREFYLEPIIVNPKIEIPSVIADLIDSTFDGLNNGNYPVTSAEGTGGAYFMLDENGNKYISVFKPIDEEPMAVNNPRGLPLSINGEGLKKGTKVGEGALREVAAYILDHPKRNHRLLSSEDKGFSGVPPTVLVKCLHDGFYHPERVMVKIGSLQMFMENCGSCEDMGPNAFPVEEVHKISVLDIRMANADRHAGNILVSKDEDGRTLLIPIDHGYCLPDSFEDCTFDWLYWPQARQPYSSETIDYIKRLDAEEDIALLKFYGWDLPSECARTFRISTMLLKKGVEKGLTPFTIGSIMCRQTLNEPSVIEEIVEEAEDHSLPGSSEAAFLESVAQIMNRRLDGICLN